MLSYIMISNPQGSATRAMGVVLNTNQQNETYLALGLQIPRDKISERVEGGQRNPRREEKRWREGEFITFLSQVFLEDFRQREVEVVEKRKYKQTKSERLKDKS